MRNKNGTRQAPKVACRPTPSSDTPTARVRTSLLAHDPYSHGVAISGQALHPHSRTSGCWGTPHIHLVPKLHSCSQCSRASHASSTCTTVMHPYRATVRATRTTETTQETHTNTACIGITGTFVGCSLDGQVSTRRLPTNAERLSPPPGGFAHRTSGPEGAVDIRRTSTARRS